MNLIARRKNEQQESTAVRVGDVIIGGPQLVVIAGPCAIESYEQILGTALEVQRLGASLLRGGAYKPRTSPYSFRGKREEGLEILAQVKALTGLPVVTEIMDARDLEEVAKVADMLQIGSRNMQNYTLLTEVGKSKLPVFLKRGLASTLEEWLYAAEYIMAEGNDQVVLCERGIRTFENYTRNTVDITAIPALKELSHLPVFLDPSHGTGRASLVSPVALGGIAAGADGLMIEVHPQPELALSDGDQSLDFEAFAELMERARPVAKAVGREI
ncbi:phospho-2-dehydro-3-deoxyheptonate aldolase [Desulfosporosinus orientis DSM 765]|uniref:Phospho-2-dehydro-3-deoxyheptonate aldolase n=1 Tax=Desulfosporosinus orientis (strain ATCC 19365 / DSM 765 / NCIMB 8382 / VKM B-1628 / Singapore I) TaxID=768706 RepID=G7WAM1_DESOD|nr:3-deoxy-7-phosphoheptulonate synthase [Desulfosporosinus orientis]AET66789.1 phospho-2-dehydro-3-deoxyheptonate aldolase [Desulfosporosinus orientis DSM 765]